MRTTTGAAARAQSQTELLTAGSAKHSVASAELLAEILACLDDAKAEDVVSNACIEAANDFDHDKVKADADAYKLTDAFAALDVDAIKMHLYDQAIPA